MDNGEHGCGEPMLPKSPTESSQGLYDMNKEAPNKNGKVVVEKDVAIPNGHNYNTNLGIPTLTGKENSGANGNGTTLPVVVVEDGFDDGEGYNLPIGSGGIFSRWVERVEARIRQFTSRHRTGIRLTIYGIMLLLYLAYFSYAMYFRFGDEGSIVLLVVTIALMWKLTFIALDQRGIVLTSPIFLTKFVRSHKGRQLKRVVRMMAYFVAGGAALVYLSVDIFPNSGQNLQSFLGVLVMMFLCFLMSANPSKVNWHTVYWSFLVQFGIAVLTLRTDIGYSIFKWLGDKALLLLGFSNAGSKLVISDDFDTMGLAFSSSGVIIFTNAMVFLLNQWGVIEFIVLKFGGFLAFFLETGPVESVIAAANIFLGLFEAPLLIKPYLPIITKSELHTIMACGFASISGGVMALFISVGAPANHLLTAAVISAPAALGLSKLMYPETERVCLDKQGNIHVKDTSDDAKSNGLNAYSEGAVLGLAIAASVWSNMLAFVSMLDLLNNLVSFLGQRVGVDDMNFEMLCSYVLFPLAYAMGTDISDCKAMGALLGIKMFATPFVSYQILGKMIENREEFETYTSNPNNTWHYDGDDIVLDFTNQTLVRGVLTERSEVIATYAMCGLSAFPAIGMSLGAIIPLFPPRKPDVVSLVTPAFISGNLASCITGAVSGIMFTPGSVSTV